MAFFQNARSNGRLLFLSLAALGIVYGDIGTSPLYTINQVFFSQTSILPTPENVLGAISLVVWIITLIVAVKYLIFVLRADHDGEGGVFALYSLMNKKKTMTTGIIMLMLVFAAGLLFGDGMITPAISVLSAIEGLEIATPFFEPYIIPITIVILTFLFAIQRKGTSKIGGFFGPIIFVWFCAIGFFGIQQIMAHPEILQVFDPRHFIALIQKIGFHKSLLVLGSVMLAITGSEALYADLGHFGKSPIRLSWYTFVYPALLLNYLGQGAYLLGSTDIKAGNIFYSMIPENFVYPMVILATAATIIASQALISGAFSLSFQAIALGLFPRLRMIHTHFQQRGQIYIPFVNWALYAGCVLLVIFFRTSSNLAGAYGLAVSGVMLATSIAMIPVAHYLWNWHMLKTIAVFGTFIIIDGAFLASTSLKFFSGGFIPFGIGIFGSLMMITWRWGRRTIFEAYNNEPTMTVSELLKTQIAVTRVERTMVFMAHKAIQSSDDKVPVIVQLFLNRYGVLPKNIILLDVVTKKNPYIKDRRYEIRVFERHHTQGSLIAVTVKFGFMEDHNLEPVLAELARNTEIGFESDVSKLEFHMSHERIFPSPKMSLFTHLRLWIYTLLRHVSYPSYHYFNLGKEVNLSMEIIPIVLK